MVQKKYTEEKPKIKCLFQVQYVRSKHWFYLDIKWVKYNGSTRETQFFKRLFQTKIKGRVRLTYPIFSVTIVNAKETGEIE